MIRPIGKVEVEDHSVLVSCGIRFEQDLSLGPFLVLVPIHGYDPMLAAYD